MLKVVFGHDSDDQQIDIAKQGSISTTVLCVCTFHVSLIQNLHFCVTAPLIYILSDGLDREGAAWHLFTPIFPSLFPWNPYLTPFPYPPPLLPSIKPPPHNG